MQNTRSPQPQGYKISSPVSSAERLTPVRSPLSNWLLVGLSVGLLAWAGRLLQTHLTSVTSVDAVINGTVVDIKAPQPGVIGQLNVNTGGAVTRNRVLLTIENNQISQLTLQGTKTRLSEQRSQLAQAQVQLNQQIALLQQVNLDQQNQSQLEVQSAQEALQQAQADLAGAVARHQLATLHFERMSFLRSQGAVPQSSLDTASVELTQRQTEINSIQTRISTAQANQKAAQLGLTLNRTRSNYDPQIRRQELQQGITNQRQYIKTLMQNIQNAQAEMTQAGKDWQRQRQRILIMPVTGVAWRMTVQPGKYVQQGDSLGQLLDCTRRWVDVFVDEKTVQSLPPGTPAQIQLYGDAAPMLRGRVSSVRSGVGRLAAGEDVAVAIAQNLPRTTQIRVDLDPNSDRGTAQQFCYVGYTAKVTFPLKYSALR